MKVLIYESLVKYLLGQLHSQEDGDQRFLDFLVLRLTLPYCAVLSECYSLCPL